MSDTYQSVLCSFAPGIEAVANEQGYGVFICNTQRDAGLEEKYLRMLGTVRPQGIIYTCNPNPDFQKQVEEIAKAIPLVIISNKEKDNDSGCY